MVTIRTPGLVLPLCLLWTACSNLYAQPRVKIYSFSSQQVQLLPGVFKDAQTTDLNYMLALNPDRLLAPYLREAGLKPTAANYPSWENTGLDGHIAGHYVSALSMMFAATGDKRIGDRLQYMLSQLKDCQDKNGNGYLGGVPGSKQLWEDVSKGKIQAGSFDLNQKWVPLYNIHKMFNGLKDAYLYTQNEQAKAMLIKFSNWFVWLTANLSDQQVQDMLRSEHGGINEVLADVYSITGDKQYLKLAYKFSQHLILNPLKNQQDSLNGLHANTQIPKVIGFKRIADLNGDTAYNTAAHFFLETILKHRTVANGGNSVREHFNPSNDFSSIISSVEGPETCNSYNMLKLAKMFYESDGFTEYIDYYERTLYNHILSSQHPVTGGFVYFTPMRPGHYRVYSQSQTSFWCCVGSGLENHAKYNELIYAHAGDNLYVNLFIPSQLHWKDKGLVIKQFTDFPESDQTLIKIDSGKTGVFTMKIRYPKWVVEQQMKIWINGKIQKISSLPGAYIALKRDWKKGDVVKVSLPMHTRTEQLPDGSNYVAVMRGPILLAAKTDTLNMQGLLADSSRMAHVASGKQYPLQSMPMFVSNDQHYSDYIHPVGGRPLVFNANQLIYPDQFKNLELIPFYKIHDSRYVIYWRTENLKSIKAFQAQLKAEEAASERLTSLTQDMVYPGEQQPESDHSFQGEASTTGVFKDRHWRKSSRYFSYNFKYTLGKPLNLRLTYHGQQGQPKFKIIVNKVLVATVSSIKNEDQFYSIDYPIPPNAMTDSLKILNVRFEAETGSETPNIYEVRLLKKE